MDIYTQLKNRVLPFLDNYRSDLEIHDKSYLESNPKSKFLHFTGNTGTTLLPLHASDLLPPSGEEIPYLFGTTNRENLIREVLTMAESMRDYNRQDLILYFDGKNFIRITQERAEEIALNYVLETI